MKRVTLFSPSQRSRMKYLTLCISMTYGMIGLCQATSVNLVVNGSFEADVTNSWFQATNITGWTGVGDKIEVGLPSVYGASGGTGRQVAEIDAERLGANTGFYQLIPTQSKRYTLSVDLGARLGYTPADNGLEIWWRNSYVGTVLPSSTILSRYMFDVEGSGGNDRLEFRERNGYDNSYGGLIDNVTIYDSIPYNCGAQASQLVVNGSFEADYTDSWMSTDSILGWSKVGDTIETGVASIYGITGATGRQVAEIDANIKSGVTGFYQNITTQNKTYTLSVDMAKRDGTPTDTNGVEVWWRNNLIATIVPSLTQFTTYKLNVPGSGGADRLEFRERAGYDNSYGGMIDNVSIIEYTLSRNCTSTNDYPDGSPTPVGYSGSLNWREVTAGQEAQDPTIAAKAAAKIARDAEKAANSNSGNGNGNGNGN